MHLLTRIRYSLEELNIWEAAVHERIYGHHRYEDVCMRALFSHYNHFLQSLVMSSMSTAPSTLDLIPAIPRPSAPFVPVTVSENQDTVVVCAVIPYYKPNTLKITVCIVREYLM